MPLDAGAGVDGPRVHVEVIPEPAGEQVAECTAVQQVRSVATEQRVTSRFGRPAADTVAVQLVVALATFESVQT